MRTQYAMYGAIFTCLWLHWASYLEVPMWMAYVTAPFVAASSSTTWHHATEPYFKQLQRRIKQLTAPPTPKEIPLEEPVKHLPVYRHVDLRDELQGVLDILKEKKPDSKGRDGTV